MQYEHDILDYWDRHRVFQRSVEDRPATNPYTFYDGPPFATGLPHYGHIVASVMKDVVPRFWTMKGYRVERRWGWDCHGLPIENIVEKEMDLASRKDIEAYGMGAFNDACRSKVLTYAGEWQKVIRRLGRWVDMEHAYHTMDRSFMESIWWVFKTLWEKGLIYEGRKAMHLCPRCETTLSNFEVSEGYADVTDLSVVVGVTLTSGAFQGATLLVWTTTPWTLPGNVLCAVGADMKYAVVEEEGKRSIVAQARVEALFAGKDVTVVERIAGNQLVGATYDPIFPYFSNHPNAFRVVAADFVTESEGTGIVHIAPGFGADDMALGEAENVPPIMHVEKNGQFIPALAQSLTDEGYPVAGVPVKAKGNYSEVDIQIIKWLAHHGKLFAKEKFTHSYPHCWRCDTPLINYSTSSWFVRVSSMVDDLLKNNEPIHWVPGHIKEGRFGDWLAHARDWAISRSRFWGTPLPVWKSEDGDVLVIGSADELAQYCGRAVEDLHKHVIDPIVIEHKGKTYRRIPEVLDCWFESGSMPYAQQHYPFEHQEDFAKLFPAQFIAEGQDQTRCWFYTLHVLAHALFGTHAFENVIVNGIVLAEDGKKMSKKLKNYPDPMEVLERYGADAMRLYLMSTPVVAAENLRFAEAGVAEVARSFVGITRNVLAFYRLYAQHDDGRTPAAASVLDQWMLARVAETLAEETAALEAYELDRAARVLQPLVTDCSTWFVRRSRERVKGEGEDRAEALATLRVTLETLAKMMAPFAPFLAEDVYQGIGGAYSGQEDRLSVHLEMWPTAAQLPAVDAAVLGRMEIVRGLVSRGLEQRERGGVPLKQVLGAAVLFVLGGQLPEEDAALLRDELNIKTTSVADGDLEVSLDLELTPELLREGLAREVTRKVNQLRKDAGLTIAQRIHLFVASDHPDALQMLKEHADALQRNVLADHLELGRPTAPLLTQAEFTAGEVTLWVGIALVL